MFCKLLPWDGFWHEVAHGQLKVAEAAAAALQLA
jgi:hypothetical protein